ncbi:hypothetical protein KY363_00255 [Candidatus Woesearchaeota archaeon]|nr:hypothetical protein [Candidatus Woesearchaeota archaeon]
MKQAEKIIFLSFIILFSASAQAFYLKETLFEGESKNFTSDGYMYQVKLITVYDSVKKAVFEVNGESTGNLETDDTYRFSDGASIFIREIMPQSSGKDLVQYNFFPAEHTAAATATSFPENAAETVPAEETPPAAIAETPQPADESTAVQEPPAAETSADENPQLTTKPGLWARIKSWLKGLFGRG